MVSASNIGIQSGNPTTQPDLATVVSNQGNIVGNDNTALNNNLLTPLFQPLANISNIPLLVFFLFIGTAILYAIVVYVLKKSHNQLLGGIVTVFGEIVLYKLGIYEWWAMLITIIPLAALIIWERKPAM